MKETVGPYVMLMAWGIYMFEESLQKGKWSEQNGFQIEIFQKR